MLKIESLSKTFGKGTINEKLALDNINLELDEGEFVTIIGGNGAGKSTLINCISGVYETDRGRIYIDQKNITKESEFKRSRYIGRVFQDPMKGTAFDMTIEENLAIAYGKGKPLGLNRGIGKQDIAFFKECLSRLELGLENRMKHKVGLLSGGQRQALTLLMATIVKPKMLLLDEHTAALDPGTARKVLELTREIVSEHKLCTMMITHNMKAALEYGTRTLLMHDGKIMIDLKGQDRDDMTVDKLIEQFERRSGTLLDNDRMLLG